MRIPKSFRAWLDSWKTKPARDLQENADKLLDMCKETLKESQGLQRKLLNKNSDDWAKQSDKMLQKRQRIAEYLKTLHGEEDKCPGFEAHEIAYFAHWKALRDHGTELVFKAVMPKPGPFEEQCWCVEVRAAWLPVTSDTYTITSTSLYKVFETARELMEKRLKEMDIELPF